MRPSREHRALERRLLRELSPGLKPCWRALLWAMSFTALGLGAGTLAAQLATLKQAERVRSALTAKLEVQLEYLERVSLTLPEKAQIRRLACPDEADGSSLQPQSAPGLSGLRTQSLPGSASAPMELIAVHGQKRRIRPGVYEVRFIPVADDANPDAPPDVSAGAAAAAD